MDAVNEIARRLADPEALRHGVLQGGAWVQHAQGVRVPAFIPLSFGSGYPAAALLFAELGRRDPSYREVAHRHLTKAAEHVAGLGAGVEVGGLHGGIGALAFALRMAAHRAGAYTTILKKLDDALHRQCRRLVASETDRMARGEPVAFHTYDTVSGLTGLGRYLLLAGGPGQGELKEVLACLVALTEPTAHVDGRSARRPGWWAGHPPFLGERGPREHANLGLAHGIAGPLALLALAWEAGIRVPGQDRAVQRVVDWLLDNRGFDEAGAYWPAFVAGAPAGPSTGGPRGVPKRWGPAWCYGSLGTARAVQLAGRAFNEREWVGAASAAITAEAARIQELTEGDCGLCHGWAGHLQVLSRFERDVPGTVPAGLADLLAERVLAGARLESAFLFPFQRPDGSVADEPGLLQGAVGVALALTHYTDPDAPGTEWDAALLLG
ncbi:lanthionine synthetase C family protein [Streptacidiphilus carbonis]|uniref:lanthionine synthetase C family protein n=1 Tax=Streptacidiphilus carbonis TaxID=105422 RepID=UPI000694BDCB|nr:lanthionine synthetase C family protein [Streptacidiphilus carbonis]